MKLALSLALFVCVLAAVYCTPAPGSRTSPDDKPAPESWSTSEDEPTPAPSDTPAVDSTPAPSPTPAVDPTRPPAPAPESCQQEGLKRGDETNCRSYLECKDGRFVSKSCLWPWKFDSVRRECVLFNAKCTV